MISLRPLDRAEWAAFRDVRLEALRAEPRAFSASPEAWAARPPRDWQDLISGDGHQAFGLFDDGRLVGITGVVTAKEDPSGRTALLVMSYLPSAYRGRGFSRLFYEARLEWVRSRGTFTSVVVSHRESNEASRQANRRHGFLFTHAVSRDWPDGTTEQELFYALSVPPPVRPL